MPIHARCARSSLMARPLVALLGAAARRPRADPAIPHWRSRLARAANGATVGAGDGFPRPSFAPPGRQRGGRRHVEQRRSSAPGLDATPWRLPVSRLEYAAGWWRALSCSQATLQRITRDKPCRSSVVSSTQRSEVEMVFCASSRSYERRDSHDAAIETLTTSGPARQAPPLPRGRGAVVVLHERVHTAARPVELFRRSLIEWGRQP